MNKILSILTVVSSSCVCPADTACSAVRLSAPPDASLTATMPRQAPIKVLGRGEEYRALRLGNLGGEGM
ncbi:hypothetical protein PF008_g21950 [Phytophthora fragariae]|uniref:Pectate lyase n=1 Tax=Phytophthora fragariae TaxID=53985 RepID=A0A6G0QVC3_9STRA|nr:hypothetical protein PF008_g21950 [Phytophthora fragariae]